MATELISGETSRRRLESMSRLFTKSDSVLAGKHVSVAVYDKTNYIKAPSWTDGKTITFNRALIGDITDVEDIIRVTGLNYHELAHVLYTPRPDRPMVQAVQAEGMFNAFNLLEDQRIETFLTAQYPSTIPYLVSTFMRFCLMHDKSWESNFVLMYGRRYLPRDVRSEFRRRFRRQDLIAQFEEIIDRYRKLVFPADESEGLTLVRDYHYLLTEMNKTGQNPIDLHRHDDRPESITCGRPVKQQDQQDAADNSDVLDDAFDADDTPADDSDTDDSGANGNDGDGPDASNQDGDIAQDAPDFGDGGADSDADDASDSDDDAPTGSGDAKPGNTTSSDDTPQSDTNGKGTDTGGKTGQPDLQQPSDPPMPDDDLRDMLDEIAKAFEDMPEVQEEVANAQKTIVQGDGDVSSGFDAPYSFTELDIRPDDAQSVRAFSRQLERLRADADPGWNTHQQSGRLNVKRAISGASMERLFDRWDEGYSDVADIECVVLIDTSGSMRSEIDAASRAMWTVKRAMESIDASVTVFSYNSETVKVYDRHEKAKPGVYKAMGVTGWTKPRTAIKEALHILTTTRRSNRIFIVITDGQWDDEEINTRNPHTADDLISLMNDQGITTALASIGPYGLESHKCSVVAQVNSSTDLPAFAKQIVSQTMKNGR